jgi:regulatory subunit for Cdc7p protein kinase
MGMKIWSLEKLNRMLSSMFNNATGEAPTLTHSRTPSTTSRDPRGADLSQLLQKEKQYGQATQDWAADMAPFRGCYVYIHDIEEKTRPVMIRDYPRPAAKEQGKWPQLRANGPGRCPFLNDPSYREQGERPAAEQAPRTRAAAAAMQSRDVPERRPLAENNNLARRPRAVSTQPDDHVKPLDPPKSIPIKRGTSTDTLPLFGSAQASLRNHPRFAGGEPVASGVQPSNVTSAIRSQMISSTAAAPGAKAGSSKELNRLGRRVFENNGGASNAAQLNDIRAAINAGSNGARGSKRKASETLAGIHEDGGEEDEQEDQPRRTATVIRKKKAAEKELKPGYCENCRVKFNDFDEVCCSSFRLGEQALTMI